MYFFNPDLYVIIPPPGEKCRLEPQVIDIRSQSHFPTVFFKKTGRNNLTFVNIGNIFPIKALMPYFMIHQKGGKTYVY